MDVKKLTYNFVAKNKKRGQLSGLAINLHFIDRVSITLLPKIKLKYIKFYILPFSLQYKGPEIYIKLYKLYLII